MKNAIRAGISRQFRYIAIALMGLALVACETVPLEEFNAYRESVAAARVASEEVYSRLGAQQEFIRTIVGDEQAGARVQIVPASVSVEEPVEVTIQDITVARAGAWANLVELNDALAFLAEGRSVEQLKTSFGGFSKGLQSLVTASGNAIPGLGTMLTAVGVFAEEVERAQSQQEFLRIVRGPGNEIVNGLIDALIEDAKGLDRVSRRAAEIRVDAIHIELARMHGRPMVTYLASLHADQRTAAINQLVQEAVTLRTEVQARALMLSRPDSVLTADDQAILDHRAQWLDDDRIFTAGNVPDHADDNAPLVESQVEQFLVGIRASRADVDQVLDQYSKENAAIREYLGLLRTVRSRMLAVVNFEPSQADQIEAATQIATSIIRVRQSIKAAEAALD